MADAGVLLGLNAQQDQRQDQEPDAGVAPPGLSLVAQVEDAERQRDDDQDDDGGNAPRRVQALMRDDVVEGVKIHAPSRFMRVDVTAQH